MSPGSFAVPCIRVCYFRLCRYYVTGGTFPVGRNSLRLDSPWYLLVKPGVLAITAYAAPVPFRASYFTSGLHPPDATAQRLIGYLYSQRDFPSISSLRFVAHAYQILLYSAYWSGDFRRAHTEAEQGMQLYNPQQHSSPKYSLDLGVTFLTLDAWTLWYLGYPDQALHKSHTSVAVARDLAHPYTMAWALNAASWMYIYRGEGQAAYTLAGEAIAFSAARDFPHWVAMGMQMQGVALAELGQWQEGLTRLKEGHAAYLATGAVLAREWRVAQIAKIHGQGGYVEEGLQVMDEALAFLEYSEVRFSEAEIYRLKGELVLQSKASLKQVKDKSRTSQRQVSDKSKQVHSHRFPTPDSRPPRRSRSVLSQGHRHCPHAAGKVARTAGDNKLGSLMATTEQNKTSSQAVGRDLQLVHRRL
jgi:hypothetical protein